LKRVRILIGEMPQMLRDIVEDTVRLQPDMELVNWRGGRDFATAVKRGQAEVVIVGGRGQEGPAAHERLLLEDPRLKVLVVSEDGRAAHLLELRQVPIAEVSPQGLVDAIREAVAPHAS
jgi:DNA-binding NarL/FixJ family response regulator